MKEVRLRRLLGEVLLIVIGVLAAFALESAWNNRRDRQEERHRLTEMRSEFATSKVVLDSLAARHRDRATKIERLETLLAAAYDGMPRDSVLDLGQSLWEFNDYNPTMPAYEELLATSGLQAVHSDTLRRALFDYELALKRNTDWDEYIRSSSIASWEPFLARRMPYLEARVATDPLRRLLPDVMRLAADLEFRNLIAVRKWMEYGLSDRRDALESKVDRVIMLIDAELES
jgi:hypothetical protein